MAGVVQLVPVGSLARALVKDFADPIRAQFDLEVTLGPPLAEPTYAYNKNRNQHHSTAILRRLAAVRGKDQLGVLGVAEVDLFVPDADFVFGEADRESKTAVISVARLRPEFYGAPPDGDLMKARARCEATHEVGHLSGLSHCEKLQCVMFHSASAIDTDRRGSGLCADCRAELARFARLL